MLLGRPPFETTNLKETYRCIREARYTMPSSLLAPAKHLIASMLSKNPEDRPHLDDIIRHEFFLQVGVFSRVSVPRCGCRRSPEVTDRLSSRSTGLHPRQALVQLLPHGPRFPPVQPREEFLQESRSGSFRWQERQSQIP